MTVHRRAEFDILNTILLDFELEQTNESSENILISKILFILYP